jgi:hypothetical protein
MKTVFPVSNNYDSMDLKALRYIGAQVGLDMTGVDGVKKNASVLKLLTPDIERQIVFTYIVVFAEKMKHQYIGLLISLDISFVSLTDEISGILVSASIYKWKALILEKTNSKTFLEGVSTLNQIQTHLEQSGFSDSFNMFVKTTHKTHFYLESR